MDILGVLFILLFLIILIVTNIIFIKILKKNGIQNFNYKLLFFLGCIASFSIVIIFYYIIHKNIIIDLLEIEINNNKKTRIIIFISVFILNSIANFAILKIYLKMILTKNKKKHEIELIGKE